uniref:Helix-turn-helix domain-containing protein n=1 Tax=Desulfobacca acetoxidans TaxID=60893 RepID=A0A7C3WGW5_9BACT
MSQSKLARALGVRPLTVARWEWGMHRLPALLPLALEALEPSRRRLIRFRFGYS